MSAILMILGHPIMRLLGWALLHFVWQAGVIAAFAALMLVVMQRASSQVRYLVLCGAMAVMAACPALTWYWMAKEMKSTLDSQVEHQPDRLDSLPIQSNPIVASPIMAVSRSNDSAMSAEPTESVAAMREPGSETGPFETPRSTVVSLRWFEKLRSGVELNLPWLVTAWLFGVFVLSLKLLIGWRIVQRLRRDRVTPADTSWQSRLDHFAGRMGIARSIRLVESALVDVPTVIGWLRPMILLPVSFLSGLTAEHVEAVLAHELAHIRRHDFLVNLIQTAIEVLLFYHPAVWWLSRRIRDEREHCCDDTAVRVCGSRVTYARALATMEEIRSTSNQNAKTTLAVAADGGSLLQRIRRIAVGSSPAADKSAWWGASLFAMSTVALLGLAVYTFSQSKIQAESPVVANTAGTEATVPLESATLEAEAVPSVGPADSPLKADLLLVQLDTAIDAGGRRTLTANLHSPWQIFQGLLAFKQDLQIKLGDEKINALKWISTGEPQFEMKPLLLKTPDGGKFQSFTRPFAFEGYPAQFLAFLSESNLPATHAFKVGNDEITIADIVNNTKKEVNGREEVTWVLWGLQHYLATDAQWLNQANESWSIERLVKIETAAAVVAAPNGGNDRLFALTRARDKHLKNGGQLNGVWAEADHKIRQHIETAQKFQNTDGSFSSRYFENSGSTNDINQRLATTGHTMEFLSIALTRERLEEPWIRNAVTALCADLIANRQRPMDCGPLYHTLNALITYRDRIRWNTKASVEVIEGTSKVVEIKEWLTHIDGFDPKVISVTALAKDKLRIQGLKQGVTSMVVTDRKKQIHTIEVLVSGDAPKKPDAAVLAQADAANPLDKFGPVSNGIRCRLVAVPASIDDESPDVTKTAATFRRTDDLTFAVELRNVSDQPVTLLGVRYGDSYAMAAGKLNTEFFGPHLFEFEFMDANGKPVPRPLRAFERDLLEMSGASAHVVAPGESLVVALRPAKFHAPMDLRLAPGQYRVRVRYRGPSAETVAKIKQHWPDKPQASAWTHAATSNEAAFTVAPDSNAAKPANLVWGKAKDGLQAAIEFRRLPPSNGAVGVEGSPSAAPGVPVKTGVGVVFHVKNVSDKIITFASETGRQGDTIKVTDSAGEDVTVKNAWFSGWPVLVRWTLKPGEIAELNVLSSGIYSIEQPGQYTVRYTIRFNSMQSKDDKGNITFPLKGDWQSELDTGDVELFLRERTEEDDTRERPPTFVARIEFVGPNGQPVESGTFTLRSAVPRDDHSNVPLQRGPIKIPGCSLAPASLTVRAPGFEEAMFYDIKLKPSETKRFELIPTTPARFKLVSAGDGQPIVGAKIRFFNKTSGLASSGPIPMDGFAGPVWATSQTDGTVSLDSLQRIDPYYSKLGDSVYFFCIEAPAAPEAKQTPPPRIVGPVKAGQNLGEIKLALPLEVRGEIRGTAEELKRFAAEWDQPFAMKTDNPDATWDYAVSKRLETKVEGDKLTFHLTGLIPGRLRFISNFGPHPHSVSHTYSRRDPKGSDVVVTVDLTESLGNLVITPQGLEPAKP